MKDKAIPDEVPEDASSRPSMMNALDDIFATDHLLGFAEKLTRFAQVLTNAHWACLLSNGDDAEPIVITGSLPENQTDDVVATVSELLVDPAASTPSTIAKPPVLLSRVALPNSGHAVLVLGVSQNGRVQSALAYERMVFLSSLTFARNQPDDRVRQDALVTEIQAIAQNQTSDLTKLVNLLALHTAASYAAAAFLNDGDVDGLKISGQDKGAKRANLPQKLRVEMHSTATKRLLSSGRSFAAAVDQSDGLILHAENPTRNLGTLQQMSALFALVQQKRKRRWISISRLVKLGSAALILLGIGLIPLPDSVELPALVEAEIQRTVTAPITATLQNVLVKDGDRLPAQGAVLVEMDSTELETELTGVRAEQSKALLEREASRAARNPAALRNAELEVQRLKSRISLLEFQKANATVLAPISGLIIAPDLKEREGTTIRQGEDLLTIADPSKLRLRLSIPENQIGKLKDNAEGIFRPDFDPTIRIESTMTLISPAKFGEGAEEMFLGRASLDGATQGLRHGLSGVLAVQRDTKPLGLIVYRAIRNYILLRIWI
jgi:multidrug resistance efflux pump